MLKILTLGISLDVLTGRTYGQYLPLPTIPPFGNRWNGFPAASTAPPTAVVAYSSSVAASSRDTIPTNFSPLVTTSPKTPTFPNDSTNTPSRIYGFEFNRIRSFLDSVTTFVDFYIALAKLLLLLLLAPFPSLLSIYVAVNLFLDIFCPMFIRYFRLIA